MARGMLHVPGATDEGGRENDALTDGAEVMVSVVDSIGETTVLCCSKLVLVRLVPTKSVILDASVYVNQPLLEKAAIVEEKRAVGIPGHDAERGVGSHGELPANFDCPLCISHSKRLAVFHAQAVSWRTGGEQERVAEGVEVRGEVVKELKAAVGGVYADVSVVSGTLARAQHHGLRDERGYGIVSLEVVSTGVVFPGWANEVKSHVGEARRREPESGCSFEIAGHGEGKLTEARDVGVLLLEHACKEGENRLA